MARVALVTGGTRGIGAAISKALKDAGYKVAASYAGNDTAAAKFKDTTGIPVFKWDVGSFEACGEGIKKVEGELEAPSTCSSTMPASRAIHSFIACRSSSGTRS
jgi:acetoacetyl-CoA reductase